MSGIDNRAHRRRKFERQKKLYVFTAIFIIVLLVVGFAVKLFIKLSGPNKNDEGTSTSKPSTYAETTVESTAETITLTAAETTLLTTVETTAEPTSAEPGTSEPKSVTATTEGTTAVGTTAPPVSPTTSAPVTTGAVNVPKGKHRSLVGESKPVDMSYFDDAAFLGDSRQHSFVIFNGLPASTNYSYVSLAVNNVRTKKVAPYNGQRISPFDALKKNKKFTKVYLMFGLNECGWPYPDVFIKMYSELIDDIKSMNPNAVIYVQSVLPVTKKVSQTSKTGETKANIDRMNKLILEMADEKGVYYLDVASVMCDPEGYLPADASADGIHPEKKYCEIWLNYLRTHTVKK